jgi:integrase
MVPNGVPPAPEPILTVGDSSAGDPRDQRTIGEVIQLYLQHAQRELSERTYQDNVASVLGRFSAACGHLVINSCRPFDLQQWLDQHPEFASNWTIKRVIGTIKRAFNWALDMGLTSRNPFTQLRHRCNLRGRRPMTVHEYQTILRNSAPAFRRFVVFLKYSGCRPSEAARMKWSDVRFDLSCVTLREHKTAKRTGRPRTIPLVPTTVKLLVWLREHPQVSATELLYRLLQDGSVNAATVAKRMAAYGISYHAVQRARKALRVIKERFGPAGSRGRYVYSLGKKSRPRIPRREYVFLNAKGNPWHRSAIACTMGRLRRRTAGL